MKKKTIITLIIILILLLALLVMCIPRIRRYKDGGTVEYKAILYSVQKVHSISYGSYAEGTKIRILFWTVYDDVVWPAPSDDESGVSVTDNPDTPAKSEEEIIEGSYVKSLSCGYISQYNRPEPDYIYLISTEDEIESAEIYLGMKAPDNEDELWHFRTDISDAFQEMKDKYPVSDYSYLLLYSEYSCGGYYNHADSVVYTDNIIRFHYDISKSPEGDTVTDIMEGDFHMAAIPKSFFEGKKFDNVIKPPTEKDIENKKLIMDATGLSDSAVTRIVICLNLFEIGAIQSIDVTTNDAERTMDIITEDGNNYKIYLTYESISAIENVTTGEWPLESYR